MFVTGEYLKLTNKDTNLFSLKSPCKNCPFRKEQSYLNPGRIAEIMEYMSDQDLIFYCHKSSSLDCEVQYDEALELLENELNSSIRALSDTEVDEIILKHEIPRLKYLLEHSRLTTQKVCAGWLILGKKEELIFNNFRLRLAVAQGLCKHSKEFHTQVAPKLLI